MKYLFLTLVLPLSLVINPKPRTIKQKEHIYVVTPYHIFIEKDSAGIKKQVEIF